MTLLSLATASAKRALRTLGVVALSIAVAGDEPPSEFRIFAAGPNETLKGTFVFDEAAAASVMAEYQAHGIDLMVDYDHASLGTMFAADPAQAGKAAAWFGLEVRNGELWAVNVRWTEPAAEALRRKEWRFMSPAFTTDDGGRVLSLINVAITNLPATRQLQPLMAASVTALGEHAMTIEEFLKVIKALGLDQSMSLDDAMAKIKGDAPADPEDAPPPVGDGGADEATEANQAPKQDGEDKAAVMAATSRLVRLTGKATIASAVDEVEVWRQSHLKLEAETQKLAQEREALELSKRKENAATLVQLGAETPHTSGLAAGKLAKRLLDEPLDEQNKRVAALLSARGGKVPSSPNPPAKTDDAAPKGGLVVTTANGPVTLSARDVQIAKELGRTPEEYAALKRKG